MNNSSVVMKSDVSLRRNLSDYNFMLVIDTDSCDDMKSDIKKELNNLGYLKESSVYSFKDTKSTNRDYLRKQGYISSAYYEDVSPEVIINSDEKCVFTLADNDHICITAYDFGKNLRDIYEKCLNIEEKLNDKLNFAFDIDFGYLSDDFYDSGCMMNVSVCMNLKALEYFKKIDDIQDIARYRGYMFERAFNSNTKSSIYRLTTNGHLTDPKYIINDMTLLIDSISRKEIENRRILFENNPEFKDDLLRSVSMLKYSRVLDEIEGMNKIGDLLIAMDFGIVDGFNVDEILDLYDKTNKLKLEKFRENNNLNQNIGVLRSEIIKDTLERQVKN